MKVSVMLLPLAVPEPCTESQLQAPTLLEPERARAL